ncbi:hypothetical protein WJX72_011742 [[Myrmecia] bisecta]|uniref:Uncharacterized protein n=1 Tax=[Myrmecia] bisecta TaxID=41462 RepID=A0AAW1R9I8_9CHLO
MQKGEPSGDIDELFSQIKKALQSKQSKQATAAPAPSSAPKVVGHKDDIFGTGPQKQRRYDEEGLPIYTPDELDVGKGGDTPDCPFDCKCCF